jgi:nucleoside-diphosphate-sugar epimerase
MRVFVTGATGFVGSAVVQELIAAGHSVLGLARSDAAAQLLLAAGASVHRGDLEDSASLRAGAEASDGVIHTGFIHDFDRFPEVCAIDGAAIEALGSALLGSDRRLIVTAGVPSVESTGVATEADPAPEASSTYPRVSERAALSLAARGAHVSVLRLPPSVHGIGDHGFVPMLIGFARRTGMSAYIGDGSNRWAAVHRLDAARLYRLAIEGADVHATLHGVAEEGVAVREIAASIANRLRLPAVSLTGAAAAEHFGSFTFFAGANLPASGQQTQRALGWHPTQRGLMVELEDGAYL